MSFVPNRKLIQRSFDGYKLASKKLSSISKKLCSGVNAIRLIEQFSYQHVRAFSLHNHLFDDPWNQNIVYWCGGDAIMSAEFYPIDASLDVYPVFCLPAKVTSCYQAMNVSLFHLDKSLCLFSNGCGGLSLLDKTVKEGWKWLTDFDLSSLLNASLLLPFLISHAKLRLQDNLLELVTLDLQKGQDEKQSIVVTIHWYCVTFHGPIKSSTTNHTVVLKHTFVSSCMPLYTAIVNQSFFVVSESQLFSAGAHKSDCSSEVEPHYGVGYKRKCEAEDSSDKRSHTSSSGWQWTQSDSDITVTVGLPDDVTKHDISCTIDSNHLVVGFTDGTTYIRDKLHGTIDPDASAWFIEHHRLEISLEKSAPLGNWPVLLANTLQDSESATSLQHEDITDQPKPVVMEDMLEECDLSDEDAMLMVYTANGQLQYKAGLGGRQVLFSTTNPPDDQPPMFCVRHDIDALLWQPLNVQAAEEFPCQHVGSFNALGYVQASKRDKKFITCSNNLSFACMCDCRRNVYVYLQPEERATIALQYVHTLGSENTDILGIQATTNGLLFVLTNEELTVVKVN